MSFDLLTILLVSFLAGAVLGLFYFGLLWLTVRRIAVSRSPGLLVLGSLVGRLAVVISAFFLVMNGQWERLAACLFGFLVLRQVMISRIRPDALNRNDGHSEIPA